MVLYCFQVMQLKREQTFVVLMHTLRMVKRILGHQESLNTGSPVLDLLLGISFLAYGDRQNTVGGFNNTNTIKYRGWVIITNCLVLLRCGLFDTSQPFLDLLARSFAHMHGLFYLTRYEQTQETTDAGMEISVLTWLSWAYYTTSVRPHTNWKNSLVFHNKKELMMRVYTKD